MYSNGQRAMLDMDGTIDSWKCPYNRLQESEIASKHESVLWHVTVLS